MVVVFGSGFKMASLLLPERVLLTCSCSALSPLTRLYFCRHCVKLRCPLCVSHEVDSYYCPNCLENMPSAEAKLKKNRCANCFDCPSCGNTLSTRATAVAVQADSSGSPKDEAKLMQAKKVYYLACGFCRWTSRDIGIADKTVASGAWQEQDNPATKRVNTLVEYYRQLAQKEKLEREKKKLSRRRNYIHLADKFGLSIRRRTSSLSFLTTNLGAKGKDAVGEEVVLKEPSVAEEEVETLPPELYTKTLELEQIPMLSQRLCQPDFQPTIVNELYPRHKHLLAKRSQRCRECEHNLSKPEFNPSSIKFKIQLGAVHYVPRLRVAEVPSLKQNKEVQVTLSLTNPVENVLKISLLNVDEEKGNRDSEETEKENETLSKSQDSTEKEKDSSKDQDNQKDNDKVEEKKDESDNKNEKVDEKEKEEKKEGSLHDTKRADRRVDNKCSSLEFEETAEVVLPKMPLMLAARDEAAEFDESDSAAEMFTDDPRVVSARQANKLWFYVKVTPKKQTGDVKFSLVMQYEYKHTTSALVRGNQQPQEHIVTLLHKFHINLGPAEGGTEV